MTATRRRFGLAAAVVLCGVGIATPAWATEKGQAASGSEKVTSASWGAVGAATNTTPTTGAAFKITWAGLGSTTQYFEVDNTGSLDLSGEIYTTTNSAQNGIGGTAPTVTLTGCVGADWNTSTGKCAGTQVTLDTSAAGSTTTTTAIAVNDSLSVRAQTSATLFGFTTSVSLSTVRSEVRAATTTTS